MAAATSDRSDALAALIGPNGNAIAAAFARMRIAEEEIDAAKKRWPRRRAAIHDAFRFLCASHLGRFSDEVYRAHAREIIGRVMRSEPLEPGTDAEILVMLSEQSLVAPLASDYAHAMSVVFHRVFPNADPERYERAGHESYRGALDEILTDCRRKAARPRAIR